MEFCGFLEFDHECFFLKEIDNIDFFLSHKIRNTVLTKFNIQATRNGISKYTMEAEGEWSSSYAPS